MRCHFCGWDNPQGKETCEKCNKPLTQSESANNATNDSQAANHDRPTQRKPSVEFDPKATVRETPVDSVEKNSDKCPDCGYNLENGVCPSCGYGVPKANVAPASAELRKTIRPNRKGEKEGTFSLTPISEENGEPEGEAIAFEGNEIILNRDNTAPKNHTITSAEQAALKRENGVWTIEDRSEYKTTFVQVARKVELQNGDIILLGNQLYRFSS